MKFASKDDAIRFAEKQGKLLVSNTRNFRYLSIHHHLLCHSGWNYYVQEPKESKFRKKVYADNYKYSPGKLRMVKTK